MYHVYVRRKRGEVGAIEYVFLKRLQIFRFSDMDDACYKLCEKLVPKNYIQQGQNAKSIHQSKIKHLLEQVRRLNSFLNLMN